MTPENKIELVKRAKSLSWRVLMMLLAVGLQFGLDSLGLLNLSATQVGFIGLVLGELSKMVNNRLSK